MIAYLKQEDVQTVLESYQQSCLQDMCNVNFVMTMQLALRAVLLAASKGVMIIKSCNAPFVVSIGTHLESKQLITAKTRVEE